MTTDPQLLSGAKELAEQIAHMGTERMNQTAFMATPSTVTALQNLHKTAAELVHVLHGNATAADKLAALQSLEAAIEAAGTFGVVSSSELGDLLKKVDSLHDGMDAGNSWP